MTESESPGYAERDAEPTTDQTAGGVEPDGDDAATRGDEEAAEPGQGSEGDDA